MTNSSKPIGLPVIFLLIVLLGTVNPAAAKHHADRVLYVALGDSWTWGERASKRCDTPAPLPARSCGDGADYVDDLARMLDATAPTTYLNAGIRGARMSTLVTQAIPRIPADTTLVTIFNGWNDKDQLYADPAYTFDKWSEEVQWVVSGIKTRAPNARIIIATIINPAYAPHYLQGMPDAYAPEQRKAYATLNARMNAYWTSLGFEIVDLRCDISLYKQDTYEGPDWSHPTDTGYLHVAQRFFDVITHHVPGTPQAECPPYALTPSPKQ